MRNEGCVHKEPIELIHLPRLGQRNKIFVHCEKCELRKICFEVYDILYHLVHRQILEEEVCKKDNMDNWKKNMLL